MANKDVLYTKLKTDSPFTVSRERVRFLENYFQQDATFVTHFALARLFEEVTNGNLASNLDIPIRIDKERMRKALMSESIAIPDHLTDRQAISEFISSHGK
jgi:hypothetical protein